MADEVSIDGAEIISGRLVRVRSLVGMTGSIVLRGAGFFLFAYDISMVNLALLIFKLSGTEPWKRSFLSAAALFGAVVGQLAFGVIADRVPKQLGFVLTLSLVFVGLTASWAAPWGELQLWLLAAAQFMFGVGVGGEYPLAASISAESTDPGRLRMSGASFSLQGLGAVVAAALGYILLRFLPGHRSTVWHAGFLIGSVPCLLVIARRLWPSSSKSAPAEVGASKAPSLRLALKTHWKTLLGTAGAWFLFDISFYANSLLSNVLIEDAVLQGDPLEADDLPSVALFNLVIACLALPGYWAGVAAIGTKSLGRKRLQLLGFAGMVVVFVAVAITADMLKSQLAMFIVLYGASFFFSNMGPNTTTFVMAAECYPASIRGTMHGLSAAAGKLGAFFGAFGLSYLADQLWLVFAICAAVSLLGGVVTWLFVPSDEASDAARARDLSPELSFPPDTLIIAPTASSNSSPPSETLSYGSGSNTDESPSS